MKEVAFERPVFTATTRIVTVEMGVASLQYIKGLCYDVVLHAEFLSHLH